MNKASRIAVVLLLAPLAACSRLTAENYDKLAMGQSYDEVKVLLGEPAGCNDTLALRSCRWGDDKRHIDINFVGGKVALFSAENIK